MIPEINTFKVIFGNEELCLRVSPSSTNAVE